MDSVMINQLPELVIPRNRTFTPVNKMTVSNAEKRNPYITKWYVLFDSKNDQWISFQPKVGHTVYPCYACRDMFGSKNSFLDHVNRRGLVLKYFCGMCKKLLTFYNTCSFLLHTRDHFAESGGAVDLDKVEISTIPMDIAGFMPITNVPRLYDANDDINDFNLNICAKFFKPSDECVGKRIVYFVPNDLIFFCNSDGTNIKNHNCNNTIEVSAQSEPMILKQVNKNIPKCVFVPLISREGNETGDIPQASDESDNNMVLSGDESDVICLDDDSRSTNDEVNLRPENFALPKIQVKHFSLLSGKQHSSASSSDEDPAQKNSRQKKPAQEKNLLTCSECKKIQAVTMKEHFQEDNRPTNDETKCKKCGLISPSLCSLRAHLRVHERLSPYVCPECGRGFTDWDSLNSHMENVCFHIAKTVRYKCPAKKCGKVFAQTMTFTSHFPIAHMKVRFACSMCPKYFINEIDYNNHLPDHENGADKPCLKIHECAVCSRGIKDIKEHILKHVQDKDSRIYVYICKYCRSYYRSKQTYATHLLRCAKLLLNNQVKKEVEKIESHNDMKCRVVKFCKPCNSKIQFHCTYKDIKKVANCCPQCTTPFASDGTVKRKSFSEEQEEEEEQEYTDNIFVRRDLENGLFFCVLCEKILTGIDCGDLERHGCKYQKPVVRVVKIQKLNHLQLDQLKMNQVQMDATSASTKVEEIRQVSPSSDDFIRRKRKRVFTPAPKNKKPAPDAPTKILTASPVQFDGEYHCKFCRLKTESRKEFHDHIQEHRDVSTSYQCMECGECFVVKPSLMKHLQVFHLIKDVESYLEENECFDKEAVRMLEEHMRMVPGEDAEPVEENQCKICRQIFPDELELSKHFRVHGMAFLMKKIIK